MTDPFRYFALMVDEGDPGILASKKDVESWTALARSACEDLEKVGFPASVIGSQAPIPPPSGAHLRVYKDHPFGVALEWRPPIANDENYRKTLFMQDYEGGLLEYVTSAKRSIVTTMFKILENAGYAVKIDDYMGQGDLYRILSKPEHPLS